MSEEGSGVEYLRRLALKTMSEPVVEVPNSYVKNKTALKAEEQDLPNMHVNDIVYGDEQTLDRVKVVLRKEFGLQASHGNTLRGIVDAIKRLFVEDVQGRGVQDSAIINAQGEFLQATLEALAIYDPDGGATHIGNRIHAIIKNERDRVKSADGGASPKPNMFSEMLSSIPPENLKAPAAFEILKVCLALAVFLMQKNLAYGNSALEPLRAMSKADPAEQIRVRMDDKLSRMIRGESAGEDPAHDFVGYWVLLEVLKGRRT